MSGTELASAEAENRLLSCLINVRMGPSIAASMGLTKEDYAWSVNSFIHGAIERVLERGHQLDEAIITEELASAGHLDLVGGEAVIRSLAASPHDPNLLPEYVNIVRDRSMRRRVMEGFETGAHILMTEPDGKKAIELVQDNLYRAFDKYLANAYSGLTGADLKRAWELRKGSEDYIAFPFECMNRRAVGRARGTLSIWGAYSSDGKSTMVMASLIRAARDGHKCALFSLEMSREQLTVRLLAELTKIDSRKIEFDELDEIDKSDIESAFEEMSQWNFVLYCDPSVTVEDIRSIQMRERYDWLGIDYLQRFDFTDYSQVPRMARQLKNLALSSNATIDLLSQLIPKETRPGQNPFTRPGNHSLFGGKATAHEADNIFFIWPIREQGIDDRWHRTGEGLLICSKARQGEPEWEIPMVFIPHRVQWLEAANAV